MEEFLRSLIEHPEAIGPLLSYVTIAGVLLLTGFGLPVPEDIPLLIGGVLCYHELASLPVMIAVAFTFVLGTDMIIFGLGRRYGHHLPRLPLIRRFLTPARVLRAEQYFLDHGGKTLFIGRFMPGLRAAIFFSAGICRIPTWKMFLADGAAALLSVPTLVLLGYFGAKQFEKVRLWTAFAQGILVGSIVLVVVVVALWKWRQRSRAVAVPVAKLAARQDAMEEAIRRSA